MIALTRAIAVLQLNLFLCGCAAPTGLGHDFPVDALLRLQLDNASPETVSKVLGPAMVGNAPDPASNVLTFWYYAHRSAPPSIEDCYPDKAAMITFRGKRFVGYTLTSRVAPLTREKIRLLKVGQTSRADVISFLGAPTEQSAFGTDRTGAPGTVGYSWIEPNPDALGNKYQHLVIQFDRQNLMIGEPKIDHTMFTLDFWMCNSPRPPMMIP